MVMKDLLYRYELVSGQKVNFEKSDMLVSRNCSVRLRDEMLSIMNIRFTNGRVRYLGFPLLLRRAKALSFKDIDDKIENKLAGWAARNLSIGGRKVLIKAVSLAIPQYVMMYFLLPNKVITKDIVRFWWGQHGKTNPIHWIRREVLIKDVFC